MLHSDSWWRCRWQRSSERWTSTIGWIGLKGGDEWILVSPFLIRCLEKKKRENGFGFDLEVDVSNFSNCVTLSYYLNLINNNTCHCSGAITFACMCYLVNKNKTFFLRINRILSFIILITKHNWSLIYRFYNQQYSYTSIYKCIVKISYNETQWHYAPLTSHIRKINHKHLQNNLRVYLIFIKIIFNEYVYHQWNKNK